MTLELTPERIQLDKELCEKATPGPWYTDYQFADWNFPYTWAIWNGEDTLRSYDQVIASVTRGKVSCFHNAANAALCAECAATAKLIARARTAVPDYIAQHEADQRQIERLREVARAAEKCKALAAPLPGNIRPFTVCVHPDFQAAFSELVAALESKP